MHKEDFINEYMQVRDMLIKCGTIMSAFKQSGTWPIDQTVFNNDDFAPSISYSTIAQDFASLPLGPNNSNSGLNSLDLDSNHDTDTKLHPVSSCTHSQPTPKSSSPLATAAGDITSKFPSPTVSTSLSYPSNSMHFHYNPILFD